VVKSPEISSIERADGTTWDHITIHGKFFGTSKGRVYLEYEKGGAPYRTNCQVLSWTMDPATGESEIVFVVPRMVPQVCDVVVDPYSTLPETEEEDGFTVKPPEIVSVNTNAGTAWDQITIHGNFFGMKKGTVYLGYLVKGKPMKKNCSVASWTVDPATEKGDIVFVVPPGLAPGVYDLIVKNSVGSSDTEVGGFTVKPPEIVSVNPNGGKAGDQITIHGKFFGMKKGKVYLGYLVNGKPIKKNCSVVSWTVDPATEEGDIIFVVPPGLAPGVYDLIVTNNSAGSDTDTFTMSEN
jgi:hypothetical protein